MMRVMNAITDKFEWNRKVAFVLMLLRSELTLIRSLTNPSLPNGVRKLQPADRMYHQE